MINESWSMIVLFIFSMSFYCKPVFICLYYYYFLKKSRCTSIGYNLKIVRFYNKYHRRYVFLIPMPLVHNPVWGGVLCLAAISWLISSLYLSFYWVWFVLFCFVILKGNPNIDTLASAYIKLRHHHSSHQIIHHLIHLAEPEIEKQPEEKDSVLVQSNINSLPAILLRCYIYWKCFNIISVVGVSCQNMPSFVMPLLM